jgi:hypothetical protein
VSRRLAADAATHATECHVFTTHYTSGVYTYTRFATEETLTEREVRALIEKTELHASSLLQRSDSPEWKPASEFHELRALLREPVAKPRLLRRFQAKFRPVDDGIPDFSGIRFFGGWCLFCGIFAAYLFMPGVVQRWSSDEWPATQATAIGWSEYEYRAGDRTYTGRHPEGYLRRGQQFAIYYDPRHPERSLTRREGTAEKFARLGMMAALVLAGAGMLFRPDLLLKWKQKYVG